MSTRQTLFIIPHPAREERWAKSKSSTWFFQRLYTQAVGVGLRMLGDTRGQDMIEYALMAGLVTLAAIAAVPSIATSISTIFSKVASTMSAAASTS